jgi:DNA-binding response OmpR family regulator
LCEGARVKGHVLVVEDELSIAELVRAYLERDGYAVVWASSGEQALAEIGRHPVRLVVLDIGLPGIDGFEVCRRLRARTAVPIVILSAREDEVDRVAGLEAGADDYVVKPFSPRELVARVKAVLRRADGRLAGDRSASADEEVLAAGGVTLDRAAREVAVDGERVDLTAREFDLLAALLANAGRVLSRDRLLEDAWGLDFAAGTRTVDVHVAQLRRKLGRAALIETVRGAGYKLVA